MRPEEGQIAALLAWLLEVVCNYRMWFLFNTEKGCIYRLRELLSIFSARDGYRGFSQAVIDDAGWNLTALNWRH